MKRQNLVKITRISKSEYYDLMSELKSDLDKDLTEPQISPEKLTKKLAENLITSAETPIPDCLTCGICCYYALCVSVTNDDQTPPENYWEIMLEDAASEIVVNKYLKRTSLNCNYLSGKIRETVGCRIYDARPQTCRDFEAGSDRCHAYRRMYDLEPPLTETELIKAKENLHESNFDEKITFAMITEKEVTGKTFLTAEGFSIVRETSLLQITAFLGNDETPHIIHTFNPNEESWLEDDFLGLTKLQTKEFIERRVGTKN